MAFVVEDHERPQPGATAVTAKREALLPDAGFLRAAATGAMKFLATAFGTWRRRRETRRKPVELSDHILKDLGIPRYDLPGWTAEDIVMWRKFRRWH
jgi:uncharacterized protein YjiS (DUF1127 family)